VTVHTKKRHNEPGQSSERDGVVTQEGTLNPEPPRWRQDFPVDLPEDQYVARRDFTKFMVLTSFAFVVGQAWIGVKNYVRNHRGKPPIKRIIEVAALPIGGAVRFMYPDENSPCLLIRLHEHTYVAYDQKCTHLTCAVQPEIETGRFRCPCHHGFFDLTNGKPLAGPPRRPLARVSIEIKNGTIYATAVEESLS
jgi:Rieske Fe-S protein